MNAQFLFSVRLLSGEEIRISTSDELAPDRYWCCSFFPSGGSTEHAPYWRHGQDGLEYRPGWTVDEVMLFLSGRLHRE